MSNHITFLEQIINDFCMEYVMKRNDIADKLEQLYKKEAQIYANPIQTRPEPKAGITDEKPDDEDVGKKYNYDEDDTEKDLGFKGNEKNVGEKGTKKDLGIKKRSEPKRWDFEGPRDAIRQKD